MPPQSTEEQIEALLRTWDRDIRCENVAVLSSVKPLMSKLMQEIQDLFDENNDQATAEILEKQRLWSLLKNKFRINLEECRVPKVIAQFEREFDPVKWGYPCGLCDREVYPDAIGMCDECGLAYCVSCIHSRPGRFCPRCLSRPAQYENEDVAPKEGGGCSVKKLENLAEKEGQPWAQYNLGLVLLSATSPPDPQRAEALFRLAIDNGHPKSAWGMVKMFRDGCGVPRSMEKAREWAKKGANMGDNTCMIHYGTYLLNGEGGPKDAEQAFRYYTLAASKGGRKDGQVTLAKMHQMGWGTEISYVCAKYWYEMALQNETDRGTSRTSATLHADALAGLAAMNVETAKRTYFEKSTREYRFADAPAHSPYPESMMLIDHALGLDFPPAGMPIVKQIKDVREWIDCKIADHCASCRKSDKETAYRRCTGCRGVYYCSTKCQKEHWGAGHRGSCKAAAKRRDELAFQFQGEEDPVHSSNLSYFS